MVPEQLLAEHYSHVRNRDFYPWLVKYISSYPSYVIFVETSAENIRKLRKILGATRAHEADSSSLRNRYCPYGGANGLHLSEDGKSGEHESTMWKKVLKIDSGQFDTPIEEYISLNLYKPNRTLELRKSLHEIVNGEKRLEDEAYAIKKILSIEIVDGTTDQIDFLYWILTDPLK